MTKLMGKKIGDSHTETSFAKKDLPKETRVMGEGDMATMDHKPDRYVSLVETDGPSWGGGLRGLERRSVPY